MKAIGRHAEAWSLAVTSLIGLAAFFFPLGSGRSADTGQTGALFVAFICAAASVMLALALQTSRLSARLLAVLASLVVVDAVLRIPVVIGLAGFSPVFFLILVGGFVMGPVFGFALGAYTLLLSALLTAGFGPWLPYQMLASAWVGMGAGLVGSVFRAKGTRPPIIALAVYGCWSGFAYGLLLDVWEWPFLLGAGSSPLSWAPGLPLLELARRFGVFYLATSLVYDAFRAAGNLLLVLLVGPAVITALLRFKARFLVNWVPAANMSANVGAPSRFRPAARTD